MLLPPYLCFHLLLQCISIYIKKCLLSPGDATSSIRAPREQHLSALIKLSVSFIFVSVWASFFVIVLVYKAQSLKRRVFDSCSSSTLNREGFSFDLRYQLWSFEIFNPRDDSLCRSSISMFCLLFYQRKR